MARKNGMKNDSSSITFNTRTKAVMADMVQDNVKEKVTAVREVVSGKSNNEIILVLQYYDYDVERSIQAYLEDGAKSALADWNFTGSKAPKKKNKKKKQQQQQQNGPQNGPKSPQSISSESSVKTNGDIGDQASVMPLMNGILHIENDIAKVSTTTTVLTNLDLPRPSSPTLSEMSSVSSSHVTENGQSEVKFTEVQESEPHPHHTAKHPHNHSHRQRTHSGSHSHGHKHDKHDHDRNRTISSSSTTDDPKALAKRTAHGLEKSVKDLHRQTVSLERLKLVFSDEVEKAYKRIRSVFEEVRNCLNAREAELVQEMGCVKDMAGDTFAMRQSQAAELKVKIDRADRLDDSQLADLRAEIKHFVSDRKVDEDLGRTTRFLYDDDHLKDEIKKFGEIAPVKCAYGTTTHRTVSTTSDPDPHLPSTPSLETSGAYALTVPSATTHSSEKPNIPHLDPAQTHEMAELQRRLKNTLTLGGISVETYPDRPQSAPVNTDDQQPRPPRPDSAYNRSRGNRNRRRPQDRDRPRNTGNDSRDNRQIYNQQQGNGGERVILIGRGTRPQSGQSRPPRGGAGRGRGFGGRGRGRGDNPGGYSGPPPDEAGSQSKGENSGSRTMVSQNSTTEETSKSTPPRGQRSPRRGRGRGGGARSDGASGGSVREPQDSQSKTSSSQPSVNPGTEVGGQ